MKILVKLTIITSKNGSKTSKTKHLELGDKLEFDESEHLESISLDDIRFIYHSKDNSDESE